MNYKKYIINMDWQKFIFDPTQNIIGLMEHIAYKRFYEHDIADAAFNYCLDELTKNNWARLNNYNGKNGASPKTFFTCVYTRLVEDYARIELGRCAAPSWLNKLGQTWKKVFTLLCTHGKTPDVVLSNFDSDINNTNDILTIINTIKHKIPDCGIKGKRTVKLALEAEDDNITEINSALSTSRIDAEIEQNEFNYIMNALLGWLTGKNTTNNLETSNVLELELRSLTLDDETIVLFRCIFQENMSLPDAAKFVGMEAHTARRRRAETFAKIKEIFMKHHIDLYNL